MTIYVLCPDSDFPVGAVKGYYRYVDILNKAGYPAYILHTEEGFRCTWFENKTQIAYIKRESLLDKIIRKIWHNTNNKVTSKKLKLINGAAPIVTQDDFLIILAKGGPHIADICPGTPKIIFNRGTYYATFMGYSLDKNSLTTPYLHKDVIASLVVSDDNYDYLHYVFPKIQLFRHHNSINPSVFTYNKYKKRQISFITGKNKADIQQVINILKFRNALEDFELVPIAQKSQEEIAAIYRDSAIFLSFGLAEGFQRPPLEAMLSGCIVIGYHGRGGREYYKPEFSYPIEAGDIIGFAKTIENVINTYDVNSEKFSQMTKKASEYVLQNYSPEVEEKDIINTWGKIFKMKKVKE